MKKHPDLMTDQLFPHLPRTSITIERLAEGANVLRAFAVDERVVLLQALRSMSALSPFRHMLTPGGYRIAVAMTNCGWVGWTTDRRGYRYVTTDPITHRPWPPMPEPLLRLAMRAAVASGFEHFLPDSCLINRYDPGSQLTLHQDKDERDFSAPIVSVSLGLPAVFLFGGLPRNERPRRVRLDSGDVVVWGGPARLTFHGVAPLEDGHDSLTGRCRFNLTFRQAL